MAVCVPLQLPASLANTRNQALVCQIAEANTADTKLTIDRTRPPTELTTILTPHRKLRWAICLRDFAFACHGTGFPVNPNVELEQTFNNTRLLIAEAITDDTSYLQLNRSCRKTKSSSIGYINYAAFSFFAALKGMPNISSSNKACSSQPAEVQIAIFMP